MFKRSTSFLKSTFHALKHRNFQYFWTGQCFSLIGTFLQRTAQYWLVYTLTKSAFLVGLLGVCQFLPMLFFSLFAGVVVDRFSKKKIIILSQTMFLLQAAVLSYLTFTGTAQYWHILVLSSVYGITLTFDMPARQSFFIDLVGKEDLMNAISLNSTIVNLARIVGPAIAGLLMLHLGIAFCFFFNTLSYLLVITGLLLIRVDKKPVQREKRRVMVEIADGLQYIKKSRTLIINVLVFGIVSTFAMNNDVVIPVFAREVLGKGADGYTFLLTAAGVGSLAGALAMASISKYGVKKKILIFGGASTALLQVLMRFTTSYTVCLLLLALIGFVNLTFFNTANSIFQVYSSDEYRGRVMSVYSLLNQGSTPVGNFFAGTVMDRFGGEAGFFSCGLVTILLLIPVFFFNRKKISGWLAKEQHQI